MKDVLEEIMVWISHNKRKFIGALLGFFIGLYLIICTVIGYIIGSYSIDKEDIIRAIKRIFSNR